MSWGIYLMGKPDEIAARIDAATVPGVTEDFAPRDDQVKAAKEQAKALVASGAVGLAGDDAGVSVSLTGHANADHAPVAGWANEAVSVAVSYVTAEQVAQWDAQQAQAQTNLE